MKKRILIVAFLALIFVLSSCSTNEDVKLREADKIITTNQTVSAKELSDDEKWFQSKIDNTSRFNKLAKKKYKPSDISFNWPIFSLVEPEPPFLINARYLEEDYQPIAFVRDMGGGNYYTMYKTKEGGRQVYYFSTVDGTIYLSHQIYMYRSPKENAYKKLKKGDSLADVLKIDPALNTVIANNCASNTVPYRDRKFSTYSLLKDCLVVVRFQREWSEDNTPEDENTLNELCKIEEITFISDKKLKVGEGYSIGGGVDWVAAMQNPEHIFDFTLLPQDYS